MRTLPASLLALAAAAAMPGARPAEACGNTIILETDESVRAIKQAGEKLDDGNPAEAAAIVTKTIEGLSYGEVSFGIANKWHLLMNRGLRIYSLALVRLDGALGPWGTAQPAQRKRNVLWATNILKGLNAAKPGDAAARTDYAEALARTSPSEAKTMLEDLAHKDVLATPYAYAALARLRDTAGDAQGRDDALAKCKTMAANKSICKAPNGRAGG